MLRATIRLTIDMDTEINDQQLPWNREIDNSQKQEELKLYKPSRKLIPWNKGRGSSVFEIRKRFESKIEVLITNCWKWKGRIEKNGYGRFSYKHDQIISSHRMSYLLYRGPIDMGLTIDHLCKNKWCVNPSHLEVVTMKENLRRSFNITNINEHKTHCKSGHPFSLSNTYIRPDGSRQCKICRSIAQQKYIKKRLGDFDSV